MPRLSLTEGAACRTLLLVAAVALLAAPPVARAQGDAAKDNTPAPLPVRAVTLFSSGVGYVQREGEVDGDARVPLLFRTAQVNDILKSLTLLDEKGTVQPAIYAARDPVGRTLQSFAVDVTQPMDRTQLLNRLRGARVSVEAEGRSGAITGRIVGVESKPQATPAGGFGGLAVTPLPPNETLTVLGEAGLQSVPLGSVRSLRLLDDRVNREFNEALALLASGSDDRRRQVVLHFAGKGRRRVRVGYVTEAPLWKISYRLVLGEDDKPYLQGWALVENTTDDDWSGVRLSLISGRPVSFLQDLYQPLYLPRPVVPMDVVASPYPQLAEGAVESEEVKSVAGEPGGLGRGGFGGGLGGPGLPSAASPAPARSSGGRVSAKSAAEPIISRDADDSLLVIGDAQGLISGGVTAQAAGEKAGEQFAYHIKVPVTLPRQQAAMIPVVAQDIAGDKVSLFNADAAPRFPLSAVRLKNDTGLHLKGGPVTLFDGGTYAGDARMEDVPPGDSRLITYAVDLTVEAERQAGTTGVLTTLAVRRGLLQRTQRLRNETTYTLRSKADGPRLVLVEHPFVAEQKLVAPGKAAERTRDRYRFEVRLAPGATEKLVVRTEQPVSETVGLLDAPVDRILAYSTQGGVSARLKAALEEVARRRRRVEELQGQAAQRDAEVASIGQDQERIRKNMAALDKNTALYKRYVGQLDAQETRIQAFRAEANRLRAQAAEAQRDLRAFVGGLDIAD